MKRKLKFRDWCGLWFTVSLLLFIASVLTWQAICGAVSAVSTILGLYFFACAE